MSTRKTLIAVICLLVSYTSAAQFDDKFYFPQKEWQPIDSINYEEVWLIADEDSLNALFLKPDKPPIATILFFHGSGGNVSTYIDYVRPLVRAGYQVFAIDFRGYGKSTGSPTHVNIAKDGQQVLEYVVKRKDVRKTSLIIFGASMGTPIAVKLAKDNPGKVKALVLDGTISSMGDLAVAYAPAEQQAMIRQYVNGPYAPKEDVRSLSGMPKLFISSRQDEAVPFEQTELVFANAPEPKELLLFEGGHLQLMLIDPAKVITKLNAMLLK